jgi:hypothetical protein
MGQQQTNVDSISRKDRSQSRRAHDDGEGRVGITSEEGGVRQEARAYDLYNLSLFM